MGGPFYRDYGNAPPDGVPSTFLKHQAWYTQKAPYKEPLPYLVYNVSCGGVLYQAVSTTPASHAGLNTSVAYLKAYERFRKAIGDRADLLTSMAERKQSANMVVKRAIQLTTFARQLRRFDFAGAGKTLGLRPTYQPRRKNPFTGEPYYRPNRLRRNAESFSDNFLEYSFGWAPLVGDISTALDVLIRGPLPIKIRSTGSEGGLSYRSDEVGWYGETHVRQNYATRVHLSCQLILDNPDLLLANQLGLVNPIATAWELVPFSFLVDHFTSIGTYLSSATDFVGLTLKYPCTGISYEYVLTQTAQSGIFSPSRWSYTDTAKSKAFRRSPGPIAMPDITIRPVTGLSLQRGATYIALLLQQLKGR